MNIMRAVVDGRPRTIDNPIGYSLFLLPPEDPNLLRVRNYILDEAALSSELERIRAKVESRGVPPESEMFSSPELKGGTSFLDVLKADIQRAIQSRLDERG